MTYCHLNHQAHYVGTVSHHFLLYFYLYRFFPTVTSRRGLRKMVEQGWRRVEKMGLAGKTDEGRVEV